MTTPKNKQEPNQQIVKLLHSLSDSITELGLTNTILHLENRNKNLFLETTDVRVVTESVCEAFNIPEWVLFSNAKKYPRKYAFALWVSLCLIELKYSYKHIQLVTGRARITIYKAKQFIENYPNESVFEKKIHEKIELTKQILTEKQQNNK
jgi:hypothetical protein